MIYSTGSHTKFYHRFHVVWTTKYRYKVMRGQMRERIRENYHPNMPRTGRAYREGRAVDGSRPYVYLGPAPYCTVKGDDADQGAFILQDTARIS